MLLCHAIRQSLVVTVISCLLLVPFISLLLRNGNANRATNVHDASSADGSFSLYDKVAYLRAALPAQYFCDNGVIASLLKDRYSWKTEKSDNWLLHPQSSDIQHESCRLYLAESSIPGAGLGVYTGVDVARHESIGNPVVCIQLFDIMIQTKDKFKDTLLYDYAWQSWVVGMGQFAAWQVVSIVPGIGMAANSHPGLNNIRMHDEELYSRTKRDSTMDRNKDPGAGASSDVYGIRFHADPETYPKGYKVPTIIKGSELFANYGEVWFRGREDGGKIGPIPMREHYETANRIIQSFRKTSKQARWTMKEQEEEWHTRLAHTLGRDPRTRAALPDHVHDLERASELGTALFLTPNAVRSIEWLMEHGQCLDNLAPGASTIPQAGRGAFAMRHLQKGSVVAPVPVVQIDRNGLRMYDVVSQSDGSFRRGDTVMGHQLLLNYGFGHKNSSLALFPYSSSVQFINHDGRAPNVKIQWTTGPNRSRSEQLMEKSLDEIKSETSTGLMLELVSTRDIARGEEILMDYGREWEEAWIQHVRNWKPSKDQHDNASSFTWSEDVLSVIRTVSEQEAAPYPPNIRTACYYAHSPDPVDGHSLQWKLNRHTLLNRSLRPCSILERKRVLDADWYTVQLFSYHDIPSMERIPPSQEWIVTRVPRWAIRFVEQSHSGVEHSKTAFRHAIGLPDGVLPQHWLDL